MIQGNVESVSRDQTGFKVQGQWYNVPQGFPAPQRGDVATFEPVPEGRGTTAYNLQVQPGQRQGGYGGGGGYNGPRRGGGGGGGARKPKEPREVWGPIVGHNLLIAATLLGPGHSVQECIQVATELMQASDQLLAQVIQQHTQPQPQQPAYGQAPAGYAPQQPMPAQAPPQGYQQPQAQPQAYTQPPAQNAPAQAQGQPQPQAPQQGQGYDNNFDDDVPW